jgi:hypothetical protein
VHGEADIPDGDFLPTIRASQVAGVVAVLSALQLCASFVAFFSKAPLPAGLWLLSQAISATVLIVCLFMLWRKSSC